MKGDVKLNDSGRSAKRKRVRSPAPTPPPNTRDPSDDGNGSIYSSRHQSSGLERTEMRPSSSSSNSNGTVSSSRHRSSGPETPKSRPSGSGSARSYSTHRSSGIQRPKWRPSSSDSGASSLMHCSSGLEMPRSRPSSSGSSGAISDSRNRTSGIERPESRPSSSGSGSGSAAWSRHRLERLATPRLSSSWKKPIKSRHSPGVRREDEENAEEDIATTLKERSAQCAAKVWKDELSPKLSKLMSNVSRVSPRAFDAADEGSNDARETRPGRVDPDPSRRGGSKSRAPDIFATPVISSLLNHPFHSSCPPAAVVKFSMLALRREVRRLTDELAAKDERISELEAEAKANNIGQRGEMVLCREIDERRETSIAVQRANQPLSPELLTRVIAANNESRSDNTEGTEQIANCNTRQRIQSLSPDSYNELVLRLREELDSKKEEIEFLKLEHEIETEQLQKKVERLSSTSPPDSNGGPDERPEAKELASSLDRLRKECSSLRRSTTALRRSSAESIRRCERVMNKNYEKIASYVREEVESVREVARTDALRSELEEARRENARLEEESREAEMRRLSIESCRSSVESLRLANDAIDEGCGKMMNRANEGGESTRGEESDAREVPGLAPERTICAKCKRDIADSPLPRSESWSQFCTRFQQALLGNRSMPGHTGKLEHNGLLNDSDSDRDIFADALCSLDD